MLTKICIKCKEEKDAAEFHKHSSHADGLQSQCKECQRLIQKTDKAKATTTAYQKTDKYKAAKAAYQNTDEYKAAKAAYRKTDKYKAAKAAYQNTDERRFSRSKANAKQRGIEFIFTFEEYVALITESERCYYCGRTEKECNDLSDFVQNYDGSNPRILKLKINLGGFAHSSTHFSIDRLDSFGPYSDENCVCACSLCNELKGWGISSKSWKKIANDSINEITESCVDAGFEGG